MYHFEVDVSYSYIQDNEKSDETYRECFLKAFGMEEYDDAQWRRVFDELCNNLFDMPLMIQLFTRISSKIGFPILHEKKRDSHEICLIFLFNYTYFEKFHRVLQDVHNQCLDADSSSYTELMNFIENNE